jgi:hypothetical protein
MVENSALKKIFKKYYQRKIYANTLIYKNESGLWSYWYKNEIIESCDSEGFFTHPERKKLVKLEKIGYGGKYPNPEFYLDYKMFVDLKKPNKLIQKVTEHYFYQEKK